jgi:PAS domain S-box-containing protein
LAEVECWYSIRKLQARFFAGEYASAVDASSRAQRVLWTSPSQFETAEFHFYGALSQAASWDSAFPDQRQQHFEALAAHHKQLEVWAEICPENFENRAALVGAEIARIQGRELDAERLYEQAIRSAQANGFVHNEALANELAAHFYAARGFEKIAHTYLRDARHCYLRWGADGKVRQLDEMYPNLQEKESVLSPTSTIGAPVERLDLVTVLKVSEAVSGEIVLEKLIDTLLRTALEHAGAERGLLILPRGSELWIQAESTTAGTSVRIDLRDSPISGAEVPESLVLYAARTQESVILDDASARGAFTGDEYIRRKHARSVLCLPLIKQGKSVALLYLENNLAPHVFTPARVAVLKFLASEAATSLDNARLYGELQERESKIRRLVDSNIIGIYFFTRKDGIVEANDFFLRTLGYDREDLIAGRLRWIDLTPPEWDDRTERARAEMRTTGAIQPFEKEYFHRDGSRVPVLIGSVAFDEQRDQGVAFVLDLSEHKRAEAEARENERRYRETQTELAHANRLAAMGQLSASIAHEINQPIGAAITYANAALSWLRAQPPNWEEVRQALEFIVESGVRAGEVIDRIRALVKKAPPQKDRVEINEAIREVLALVRAEIAKNAVSAKTQLAEDLPPVWGDRVQLQQVMLNLFINAIEAMSGMDEGSRELLISTERTHSDAVLVSVRDSGPGFAPESAERLFESFYTTKAGGLGMGLSICHSIVEAHEGRLWATASLPHGAVFQFTLPAFSSGGG